MYLGPAAWRPFNAKLLDGFNFEKGGGLVGGGVLEWGSHCVDLCQWAVGDCPPPVEYNPPKDGQLVARYDNGVELIFREKGWIPLGSCPVRFEGETGWVEAGDSGKFVLSSPELLAGRNGRRNRRLSGDVPRPRFPRLREDPQPAEGQRRRGLQRAHRLPRGEHRALLESPGEIRLVKNEFIGDEQANRLRSKRCASRGGYRHRRVGQARFSDRRPTKAECRKNGGPAKASSLAP